MLWNIVGWEADLWFWFSPSMMDFICEAIACSTKSQGSVHRFLRGFVVSKSSTELVNGLLNDRFQLRHTGFREKLVQWRASDTVTIVRYGPDHGFWIPE
jgi:hypothetical protein